MFIKYAMYLLLTFIFNIGAISFFCHINAYVYQAEIWRKWDTTEQKYSYIITCADLHDHSTRLNSLQKKAIDNLIEQSDKETTSFIVEDISNYTGKSTYIHKQLQEIKALRNPDYSSVIFNLVAKIKAADKDFYNTEYRFPFNLLSIHAHTSLTELQYASSSIAESNLHYLTIEDLEECLNDFQQILKEIRAFTQPNLLNNHISKSFNQYAQNMLSKTKDTIVFIREELEHFIKLAQSINLNKKMPITDKNLLMLVKTFALKLYKDSKYTHDIARLVDLRALNYIVTTSHKQKLILFMGGEHIDTISSFLNQCDYEKVYSIGNTINLEQDPKDFFIQESKKKRLSLPLITLGMHYFLNKCSTEENSSNIYSTFMRKSFGPIHPDFFRLCLQPELTDHTFKDVPIKPWPAYSFCWTTLDTALAIAVLLRWSIGYPLSLI